MNKFEYVVLWLLAPVVSVCIRFLNKNRWWKSYKSSTKDLREGLKSRRRQANGKKSIIKSA